MDLLFGLNLAWIGNVFAGPCRRIRFKFDWHFYLCRMTEMLLSFIFSCCRLRSFQATNLNEFIRLFGDFFWFCHDLKGYISQPTIRATFDRPERSFQMKWQCHDRKDDNPDECCPWAELRNIKIIPSRANHQTIAIYRTRILFEGQTEAKVNFCS